MYWTVAETTQPKLPANVVWYGKVNGFTVVDASSVLITHLSEALKTNAHLLIGRQEVQGLVDHLRQSHPALIAELLPDLVGIGVMYFAICWPLSLYGTQLERRLAVSAR